MICCRRLRHACSNSILPVAAYQKYTRQQIVLSGPTLADASALDDASTLDDATAMMRPRGRTTATPERTRRACLDWLREHAIAFDPARGPSLRALKVLTPLLQGKRVAMLGETVQQVHETYAFRVALLRFLAGHGFNLIGAQASWSDGARIQRFLTANALTELDRTALLGYRGSARTDRDDSPADRAPGMAMGSAIGAGSATANRQQESAASRAKRLHWQSANQAAMHKEQRRFYIALRKLCERRKPEHGSISVFGFDADDSLGDTYEEIDALLRPRRHPRIDTLRQLLARVPGEDMTAEIDRLAWALDWLDLQYASLADQLGSGGFAHVRHLLALLHDSFELARVAWHTDDPARMAESHALRDTVMHSSVAYALAEHQPESKAVLIGAAQHLPKCDAGMLVLPPHHARAQPDSARRSPSADDVTNTAAVSRGAATASQGVATARASLGSFVAQTLLPEQVFSMWFIYGGGTDGQTHDLKQRQLAAPKHTLNALLRQVGGAFVLPLVELDDPRAAPLLASLQVMQSGNCAVQMRLTEQLDALYFVPQVTAVEALR